MCEAAEGLCWLDVLCLAPLSFSEDRQLIKYSGRRARARLSFLLVGGGASNRGSIEGEDLE